MADKKIHIMHVLLNLCKGGMEGGVVNVINRIDASRFKVSVCCLEQSGLLEEKIDKDRKSVFVIGKRSGKSWDLPFKLRKLFQREKVDIVHTHNYATLLYGALACGIGRRPCLVHGQHGDLPLQAGKFKYRLARRILSYRTSRFHAVSESLKKLLMQEAGLSEGKIYHIPNGLDLERFKIRDNSRLREEFGFKENDFIILGIGSLYPWKNFRLLIETGALLKSRGIGFKLILAGDGPLMSELKSLTSEKKLTKDVLFLGYRKDIADILAVSDILVQPSLTEGMSNTIMEAMASGRPVIASAVGGNVELVKDGLTGYLFESDNASALAKKITRLYEDKNKRDQMGRAGRKTAEEKFSLDRMVKEYERLYLGVMKN